MFPVALRLGDTVVTWYGICVALGFLTAVRVAIWQARRQGLSGGMVEKIAFWTIVSAVVGSRLLYVLTELPFYLEHPLQVFDPREGGLVFLGGLIGAFVVSAAIVVRNELPLWRYADAVLPHVALGHAIGRLGCFSVGCCYGTEAPGLPWAVRFPESPWQQIAPAGVPLHPVQLYEAGANLAIWGLLLWAYPRRRFDGQIALGYLGLYTAGRIVLELFRGDVARRFLFEERWGQVISTSQLFSALILAAVVATAVALRRRNAPPAGTTP